MILGYLLIWAGDIEGQRAICQDDRAGGIHQKGELQ
jgi:hypothetical protein